MLALIRVLFMVIALSAIVAGPAVADAPPTEDGAAVEDAGPLTEGAAGDDDFSEFEEEFEDEEDVVVSDPLEGFNRAMFAFNDALYTYAFRPLALAYKYAVFEPIRVGIKNAFYNLRYPGRLVNNLLQGKFKRAGQETGSFLLNSTFGLGGIVNVAQGVNGLNPPEEDFGQTLGTWGAGTGPYIVLPILGPTTLRDGLGSIVDRGLDPLFWAFLEVQENDRSFIELHDEGTETYVPLLITLGEQVNDLSFRVGDPLNGIQGDYEALKEGSLDPYVALRNAYVQSRQAAVEE